MSEKLRYLALQKSILIRNSFNSSEKANDAYKLAGFAFSGKLSWTASDSILRVISVDSGAEVAFYNFSKYHLDRDCNITCVEEVKEFHEACILAIGVEFRAGYGGKAIMSLFCVQGSKILGSMDMSEKISCLHYVPKKVANRKLPYHSGTIVLGTDKGKVFCIDLMLPETAKEITKLPNLNAIIPMHVSQEKDELYLKEEYYKALHNRTLGEQLFFAVQLPLYKRHSFEVTAILATPRSFLLCVGFADGFFALYDLNTLQAIGRVESPVDCQTPLLHFCYIEPANDPQATVYIMALHTGKNGSFAVMHNVHFGDLRGDIYGDTKSFSISLRMPLGDEGSVPVSCQTISKPVNPDEEDNEDMMKICVISWLSMPLKKSFVMIFDLNQWYKAEIPSYGNWLEKELKYAPVFELPKIAVHVYCDEKMMIPFDSIDRAEEHFLPLSHSFTVSTIEKDSFKEYYWRGLQTLVLDRYNNEGPILVYKPDLFYEELIEAVMYPKFTEELYDFTASLERKREFILTIALEYNQVNFLKKCAWAWSDGAMLGKDKTGVSLSTLTDWIWKRVWVIKGICNDLTKSLFDFSGKPIDRNTQNQLSSCYRQLKVLSDLLNIIMTDYRKSIPGVIYQRLQHQLNAINTASIYQEVVQWLLNVGLLPEGNYDHVRELRFNEQFVSVPYPYRTINSHYETQRAKLSETTEYYERIDDPNRKYLFIDAFIENECGGKKLEDEWGSCYPPRTLQALLRTLLIDDLPLENKFIIFIYLYMDISNVMCDTAYGKIVKNLIKFPTVFNVDSSTIKRTEAYWNLDNGHFDTAVDEVISPLSNGRFLPPWKQELLLCVLLKNNANALALKALRQLPNKVFPALEIAVLLANDLICEAFFIQRNCGDRALQEKFFEKVLNLPQALQLHGLDFTEDESLIFQNYLKNADATCYGNVYFSHLLKSSLVKEAAELVESIDNENVDTEPPKQILTAYLKNMESTTRRVTEITSNDFDCISNNTNNENLESFSNSLISKRITGSETIYQRCIQAINHAVFDERMKNDENIKNQSNEHPFLGYPKLGIFEYRRQTVQQNKSPQKVKLPDAADINQNGKRVLQERSLSYINDVIQEGPRTKQLRIEGVIKDSGFCSFVKQTASEVASEVACEVVKKEFENQVDPRFLKLTRFRKTTPNMSLKSLPSGLSKELDKFAASIFLPPEKPKARKTFRRTSEFDDFGLSEEEEKETAPLTAPPTTRSPLPNLPQLYKPSDFDIYDDDNDTDIDEKSSSDEEMAKPPRQSTVKFAEKLTETKILSTPFVKAQTPFQENLQEKRPPTPASILKNRSNRGSVSPAPSHASDNKSVKSIKFAPLPGTRESSIAEGSSNMEESFNTEFDDDNELPDEAIRLCSTKSVNLAQQLAGIWEKERLQDRESNMSKNDKFKNYFNDDDDTDEEVMEEEEKATTVSEELSNISIPMTTSSSEIEEDEHRVNIETSEESSSTQMSNAQKTQNYVIEIEDSDVEVVESSCQPLEVQSSFVLPPFSQVEKKQGELVQDLNKAIESSEFAEVTEVVKVAEVTETPKITQKDEATESNEATEIIETTDITELKNHPIVIQKEEEMVNVLYDDVDQITVVNKQNKIIEELKNDGIRLSEGEMELLRRKHQDLVRELIKSERAFEMKSQQSTSSAVPPTDKCPSISETSPEEETLESQISFIEGNNSVKAASEIKKQVEEDKSQPKDSDSVQEKKNPESEERQDEADIEIETIFKKSKDDKNDSEKDNNRAVSAPINKKATRPRSSRAISESRTDPKLFLKGKILERIEESPITVEGRITRSKSQLLSREATPVSPLTPYRKTTPSDDVDSSMKKSRRRSETPTTPIRKSTRNLMRDIEQTQNKEPPVTPRRTRKQSVDEVEKESPISSQASQTLEEDPSTKNRRLTRSQLTVLERSRTLATTSNVSTPKRSKLSSENTQNVSSDDESVTSAGNSSRAGRKRKSSTRYEDFETSSVTSKSSRKSSATKKADLTAIEEEDINEKGQNRKLKPSRSMKNIEEEISSSKNKKK